MPRPASLLLCFLVLALGAVAADSAQEPRCFGAASRDPEHPCHNPALRHRVVPRPRDALLYPDAPCTPVDPETSLLCYFGPHRDAPEAMALLGDSHASHWRAALLTVVAHHDWQGVSLTRPSCPFSMATPQQPEPKRSDCVQFNRDVLTFVADHPEISTVVVSQARAKIVTKAGVDEHEAQIQGYLDAWAALPDTVKHVVVIRDPPYDALDTGDCVEQARRRHRDAGRACALVRKVSLKDDVAVEAARRAARQPGARVTWVDLSRFFCGAHKCFPVVGGALVHKDDAHLTQVFSRSLGPYLLRAIDRRLASATPPAPR